MFSVDLDKYPGLFIVPNTTYPDVVVKPERITYENVDGVWQARKIPEPEQPPHLQALMEELLQEQEVLLEECLREPKPGKYVTAEKVNEELRQRYASHDEARAAYFADRILQLDFMNEHQLNILSGWQLGKDELTAVDNLLAQAERHRTLYCLYAACLLKVGQICETHGEIEAARRLYLATLACTQQKRAGMKWNGKQPRGRWYEYKAAARTRYHALIEVPEEPYDTTQFNPVSPSQRRLLQQLLRKYAFEEAEEYLLKLAQNAIRFRFVDTPPSPGDSKLGGIPDVPCGWEWPEKLEFQAQFNLREIAPYDVNGLLPREGMLSFFLEEISYWDGKPGYRVYYFEDEANSLVSANVPEDIIAMDSPEFTDINEPKIYHEVTLAPFNAIDFDPFAHRPTDIVIRKIREADGPGEDDFAALSEDLSVWDFGRKYQLLGSAAVGRNYPDEEVDEKEWTLLLRLDSSEEVGTSFCDAGVLFFLIRNEDLMARRFDRLEIVLLC